MSSENAQHDIVNNPEHYTTHPSGVECITVAEWLPFNLGNAYKYLFRRDKKENAIQDLKKALWYVEREHQRLTVHWDITYDYAPQDVKEAHSLVTYHEKGKIGIALNIIFNAVDDCADLSMAKLYLEDAAEYIKAAIAEAEES